MHVRPLQKAQKASRSLPCGTGWNGGVLDGSGRPTLSAHLRVLSFPPPEKHPGICVPPRAPARDGQHGSTASTQRMRQWLPHRRQFSYPGPPRRANPSRWARQGKEGCDQSLSLFVCGVRQLRFSSFSWLPPWPPSDLDRGRLAISYRWLGIVSGLLGWLGCLGGNGKGNRRELGHWAVEESRRVTRGTLTAVGCR